MHISTQRHSRGTKLRKLILSEQLKPDSTQLFADSPTSSPSCHRRHHSTNLDTGNSPLRDGPAADVDNRTSPSTRTHQRSKSDATTAGSTGSGLRRTGSNPRVEASHQEVRVEPQLSIKHLLFHFFFVNVSCYLSYGAKAVAE